MQSIFFLPHAVTHDLFSLSLFLSTPKLATNTKYQHAPACSLELHAWYDSVRRIQHLPSRVDRRCDLQSGIIAVASRDGKGDGRQGGEKMQKRTRKQRGRADDGVAAGDRPTATCTKLWEEGWNLRALSLSLFPAQLENDRCHPSLL